ncbi:hypothetical protein BBD32_19320 (plasmid) [Elizabethkingia anophelis]|uniref:Uncharacterized protein n=2 Tax=Elizabethkingia anophelis TaxID=1117645 RepID=A0AAU8V0J7_9FLAO|nr:hypothetical protein BBD32_19320 [Elizabethkingia anophelis]OPB64231.1 hypothetical protein BAY11_16235 [Elizabethkingia anophelis]
MGQLAQKTRDLISEASRQQKFFDITEKTNTQHKEISIKSYRSYQLPEEPRFPISKQSKTLKFIIMNTIDKRQLTIDSYTKEATNINNFTYLDSTIITFEKDTYYYSLIFTGRKTKPTYFNRATAEDIREVGINNIKKIILDKYEKNLSFIESKKAISDTIQKGTILYSDWGYEQTNINFYLVLERKNSKLILQEIGQTRTYERQDSGTCIANPEIKKGEPFERRLTKYASININEVQTATIYNGKPLNWSSSY